MAQILKQSKLSQEQEEYLDVIVKSATNLMSILNDILEYSKLESGHVEFHDKPFSINQVVEEVTASMLDKAKEKNLEVLSFQDPNIPGEVIGDPVRLRQVLKIFTDNAIKFTVQGEIAVESHFLEWDEESVKVRFSITDTGIGISEEGIKKIFFSYSKLDSPESMKQGGGGLGLAIAKRLIERMNGKICVESTLGKGTTFTFSIVFDRYKDSVITDDMKDTLSGSKILLVDGMTSRRSILRNYFERWDCEVEESADPVEALKVIQHQGEIKKPFRMIVLEYRWDESNGLEIGKILRKDPALKKTGMLLATSRDHTFTLEELEACGISGMLIRPYTLNRLKNRIKNVISGTPKIDFTQAAGDEVAQIRRKNLNILLAEDNLINQKVALVTLDRLGHRVDLAENGLLAVKMFGMKTYDLVLMDIYMPEMDGFAATARIRELESASPGNKPVFICAITANTSPEDREKCFLAGMDDYISKPFKMEELTTILGKL